MIKKHQRPTQKLRQGGIIEREGPLHLSNVMLVCDPRATSRPGSACETLADGKQGPRLPAVAARSIDKALETMADKQARTPRSRRPAGRRRRQGARRQAPSSPRRGKARRRPTPRRRPRAKGTGDGPAAAAERFRTHGDPGADEGARLHQPFAGAAAREDRHQHGRGRGQARTPRCSTSPPPICRPIAGQKPVVTRAKKSIANFKLRESVPIGCKVTLRGAAHVRVPRPARQRRPAARARLQGRAAQGLRRPRQLRAGADGADHLPRDRLRQGRQGARHGHHHRDDGADGRGGARRSSHSSACRSGSHRHHGQDLAHHEVAARRRSSSRAPTAAASSAAGPAATCASSRCAGSASASSRSRARCRASIKASW